MFNLNRIVGHLGEWLVRHPSIAATSVIVLVSILSLDLTVIYYLRTYYELFEEHSALEGESIHTLPACFVFFCMVCKIVLFVTMLLEYFSPLRQLGEYLARRRRRRFASFIVRRLICDLATASRKTSCEEASEAAYRAVAIFRRDANALLVKRLPISNGWDNIQFYVLDEEEAMLKAAGYGQIDFDVTEQVLQDLLSPPPTTTTTF